MRRAGRHLKTDESFLEKVAMGATGTQRVLDHLSQTGHRPIELERGSTSFKIWQGLKMKRLRIPDVMCVDCGVKVESRAKTRLELSMSHSSADPERAWDYGLADDDYVALLTCERAGAAPIDWKASSLVQYVRVRDLRGAYAEGKVISSDRKGVTEGFEARLVWPCAIASAAGVVSGVTNERIQYKRASDNRTISLQLERRGICLEPLCSVGAEINQYQILAAPVPIKTRFECSNALTFADYLDQLNSPSVYDRYAAAKALNYHWSEDVIQPLEGKLGDTREDELVRLEAAATLMRRGNTAGTSYIRSQLYEGYQQMRFEAAIVLAEVDTLNARCLLFEVLHDTDQHPDIRAAAAWAIGESASDEAIPHLVAAFDAEELKIRADAARALAKIAQQHTLEVTDALSEPGESRRAGVAWALSKAGNKDIDLLLDQCVDEETRRWVAYVVGSQERSQYVPELETICARDPQVYFAVTVLWQIGASWVEGLEEY